MTQQDASWPGHIASPARPLPTTCLVRQHLLSPHHCGSGKATPCSSAPLALALPAMQSCHGTLGPGHFSASPCQCVWCCFGSWIQRAAIHPASAWNVGWQRQGEHSSESLERWPRGPPLASAPDPSMVQRGTKWHCTKHHSVAQHSTQSVAWHSRVHLARYGTAHSWHRAPCHPPWCQLWRVDYTQRDLVLNLLAEQRRLASMELSWEGAMAGSCASSSPGTNLGVSPNAKHGSCGHQNPTVPTLILL